METVGYTVFVKCGAQKLDHTLAAAVSANISILRSAYCIIVMWETGADIHALLGKRKVLALRNNVVYKLTNQTKPSSLHLSPANT
jgi:hypothetical protein